MSRTGNRVGAAAVLAVILLQVAVPLIANCLQPPTRFGFQMYSGLGSTEVKIIGRDGESIPFDQQAALPGLLRPEFDWTRDLPEYLCAHVSGAHQVTVVQSTHRRTLTCP
ncbi:hypothetical protein GCM10009841_07860 [Microlunatus panaciterrae]|uniref:Uncharacterized protein n=1 Tax=Microlunatus panaciterrae TaxID=400768 RepID=A0ABS2RHS9_9ACTN|nr:hypothetical protein [Microlunatus panaciterrae]MBM7798560.1 hypothetical protein [Microlunatus panaciterrae]